MKYKYEMIATHDDNDAIDQLNKLGERGYKVFHVYQPINKSYDVFYLVKTVLITATDYSTHGELL